MVWDPMSHRATVDIDFLARTTNSIANVQRIIHEICAVEVIPDGMKYDPDSLRVKEM